ncbi:MAG: alpha-ketoacid dehydrogenase subunit beta [Actinobacteria bacterium]|nr:MAG: alpha-ketoacid dehydrogenase subunit beta [Actinomycetota bacterium]
MKQYLIEQRLLSERREEQLEQEVRDEVEEAVARAEAAAPPPASDAFTRVWARPVRPVAGAPEGAGDPVVTRPEPAPQGGVERNIVETVRDTQRDLLAADERVVILGEDVGPRGGVFRATDGLCAEFGEQRVFDTPLAESSIVGIGIGLALAGMRPIAEIQFADFIHSAFDQIVSEAAKLHYRSNGAFPVPLVIRAPWGGGVHGALYHSQCIEAFYGHVAGLKVVAPSTPADVAGLLREAVDDPDPVLFLEHKKTYRLIKGLVPEGDWRVPIGVAAVAREGEDLSIVTYGLHRHLALQAAEDLAEEASVEVIDLRTINPLDRDTILASAAKCGRVLVVHEDNTSYGVGAEVAAVVADEAFYDLDAPVRRLCMADVPAMPFAAPMEQAVSIGADTIAEAARALLGL